MKTPLEPRWDWQAAIVLILAVFTVTVRLDTTSWTPDLGYIESMAVLGTVLGLALGLSTFRIPVLRFLACCYSLLIIPLHLSRIIAGEETALGQLASLGGRLAVSLGLLWEGKPIQDYLFFVSLMSVLFWGIGLYSGYCLVRDRNILRLLLPSTLPILIIQYYDGYKPDRIWALALYFFLALMLIGRINLLNSRERWDANRVVAGSDPEFDLNKNIASAAAVIIMAAWLLPAPAAILPSAARAWRSFNQPFDNVRKRMDDLLAALNSNRNNAQAGALYGDVMGLGRTAGSGEPELFRVSVPPNSLPRLYWRMRVYDTYQNGSWQTNTSVITPFDPDNGSYVLSAIVPEPAEGEFRFNWNTNRSPMLATPLMPVWASRKGSIQISKNSEADPDPMSWIVDPALQPGDQYRVRSLLSNPSQKDLRESGDDYPEWITERYLQIPAGISDDFAKLAGQITEGLPTNFEKAEAITNYLRANITYRETIPAAPADTDPLKWFLFSQRSGFCNYYASAEVMLLRSVGIPARMVVGYAQGTRNPDGLYIVRGLDAHAWPEAYFPAIGWVQFEPTVNQNVLVRPSGEVFANGFAPGGATAFADGTRNNERFDQENDEFSGPGTPTTNTFLGLELRQWLWSIISSVFVVILGLLVWKLEQRQSFSLRAPRAIHKFVIYYNLKSPVWLERWLRWSDATAVERAFHAVNQALAWLGQPQTIYATPAERAGLLQQVLPDASEHIRLLSDALEQTLFTPHAADPVSAVRAGWKVRFLAVRKMISIRLVGE